jgi:hypothetical protein
MPYYSIRQLLASKEAYYALIVNVAFGFATNQ